MEVWQNSNMKPQYNETLRVFIYCLFFLFIYKLRTQCHTIIAETVQNSNRHWRRPTQVLKHLRVALKHINISMKLQSQCRITSNIMVNRTEMRKVIIKFTRKLKLWKFKHKQRSLKTISVTLNKSNFLKRTGVGTSSAFAIFRTVAQPFSVYLRTN